MPRLPQPMRSMSRNSRRAKRATSTAVHPRVFTVRTNAAASSLYDPRLVRKFTGRERQTLSSAPRGVTQGRNVAQDGVSSSKTQVALRNGLPAGLRPRPPEFTAADRLRGTAKVLPGLRRSTLSAADADVHPRGGRCIKIRSVGRALDNYQPGGKREVPWITARRPAMSGPAMRIL